MKDSSSLQNTLSSNPRIRIPELLFRDPTTSIIVQSDLGSLPTIYDILKSPGISLTTASKLGHIIGHFLADVHNSTVVSPFILQRFHNADAERVMEAVITQTTRFMEDAELPDARFLGNMALDHWRTRKKTVFSQGDLWFGTLLVDLHKDNQEADPFVGICDWEFAGPNDPAADIAQLGSHP